MSDSVWPHRWQPTRLPVPGILLARTVEWVAISFSNAWKWKVKVKSLSRVQPSATPWTAAHQAPPSMGFSRQEYWSGVPLPSLRSLSYLISLYVWRLSLEIQTLRFLLLWKNSFYIYLPWCPTIPPSVKGVGDTVPVFKGCTEVWTWYQHIPLRICVHTDVAHTNVRARHVWSIQKETESNREGNE